MESKNIKNDIELLSDPKYYLENFTKVKTKEGGLRPFVLKPAQLDLFNTLKKHNRIICMKARQIGFCLHPDTKILSSDLRWIRLDDIKVGQEIVTIDENKDKMKLTTVQAK